jgi:hypothetical protein
LQYFDFGNPPYHFSGLASGSYFVGALFQFSPAVNPPDDHYGTSHSEVTLSQGQQLTGVDFGFESIPANLLAEPTAEPSPTPQPTPEGPIAPTATPTTPLLPGSAGGPGSVGLVAPPSTGDGPSPAPSPDRPATALVLLFGAIGLGLGALAVAAGRRIDVRTRR